MALSQGGGCQGPGEASGLLHCCSYRRRSVGEVADVLGLTKSTSRAGDTSKNFVKSFLGWENVVHHFPNEGVITGF